MRDGPRPADGRLALEQGTAATGATYVTLSLAGEFDMTNAHRLRDQLDAILANAPVVIVVDLADLAFCDSSILGVLVVAQRHAHASGVALRLAAPPAFLRRLLTATNLDTVFQVFSDVDAAVAGSRSAR
jgi:anti-anti-sigma factor